VAGRFAGVAPNRYPSDLATFFSHQHALRAIPHRYPIPDPLPPDTFNAFLTERGGHYPDVTAKAVP